MISLVTSVVRVAASAGELGAATGAGSVVRVGVAGGAGVAVGVAGAAVGVGESDEEQATTSNKAIGKLVNLQKIP
jgi:hypothetical protein